MRAHERRDLLALAEATPSVRFADFVSDLPSYTAAADVVVSMGGYNSVTEILSFGRPAVLVPRVTPRKEQLIRANLLGRRGFVRVLHPEALAPERLLGEVLALLSAPPQARPAVDLDGLAAVGAELEALVAGQQADVAIAYA